MQSRKRLILGSGAVAVVVALIGTALTGNASADPGLTWGNIASNTDTRGIAAPNQLSPQLREYIAAQGSQALENPANGVGFYGYLSDGTLLPDPTKVQAPGNNVEASKTEPDKNTYLVMHGLHGADPNYDYGTHFLFQGHEGAVKGYITRINLDADGPHRVTLLATTQSNGAVIPAIDGSTWDPWAHKLLFTSENGPNGAVLQATPDIGSSMQDVSWVFGRGGYEAIQNDSAGNVWIVEDVGGGSPAGAKSRNPNSFIYQLVPYNKGDLTQGGKLQALQVTSHRTGNPITFQPIDAGHPTGGIFTDDQLDLSTYGISFETHWVTVHDTAVDASGLPFDANALAKAAGATPFKRPENGVFRPGSNFRDFYFTATGDTNATSDANAQYGGYGAIFKLSQGYPAADHGTLSLFYLSDAVHNSFDNITFIDRDHAAVVEDAGDGLHLQRNALDCGYLFDTRTDFAHGAQPVRFLAEGRDAAATLDNMLLPLGNGFQNEGDNEITGIHMSDGDPGVGGILGAKVPRPFKDGWRLFWTEQHGDNITWEIVSSR